MIRCLLALPMLFAVPISSHATEPASFLKDVAPVLVRNCIGCHNNRKAESKYNMVTFAQLAKGGQQGEEITLEPGKPEESRFVELLHPDASPRMPWKLDALPKDQIELIEQWVREGAKYDGGDPKEDWTLLAHKLAPVRVPEDYPVAVPITALSFGPDGGAIVSSGYHELNLWKAADGTSSRRIRGLPERIYEIAYSPDGRWMATAGGDPGQFGKATLWLAEPDGGGKPVRDLVESSDSIFAVAFSPDSKLVAAAGADRAIRIWEVETGKLQSTIEDHADWVLDIGFSPNGQRLASASRDKTAKVFDVAKHESLVTFPGHNDSVNAVAFATDGKIVASAGSDNQIRLWNPDAEGQQTAVLGGFGAPIFRLIPHPDGKRWLACSADKTVRVFENGGQKFGLTGHNDWVYSLALSPDGSTLASGSWDGEVKVWNLVDGKPIRSFVAAPGLKPKRESQASK